jgi:hypothetical protein
MISDELIAELRERIGKAGADGECRSCCGRGTTWAEHPEGGEQEVDCGPCVGKGRIAMAPQEAIAIVEELHLLRRIVSDMTEEGASAALAIRFRKALEAIRRHWEEELGRAYDAGGDMPGAAIASHMARLAYTALREGVRS